LLRPRKGRFCWPAERPYERGIQRARTSLCQKLRHGTRDRALCNDGGHAPARPRMNPPCHPQEAHPGGRISRLSLRLARAVVAPGVPPVDARQGTWPRRPCHFAPARQSGDAPAHDPRRLLTLGQSQLRLLSHRLRACPARATSSVICTANICRSPMAAGLLHHFLAGQSEPLRSLRVVSAGILARAATPSRTTPPIAMKRVGID